MSITVETLSGDEACQKLAEPWNALVVEEPQTLRGLDGTNTSQWFQAMLEAFPEAGNARVIVAREGNELVGLLPVVVGQQSVLGTRLLSATELYCGRSGLLISSQRGDVLAAMLEELNRSWPRWISLQTMLVSDSHNEHAIYKACQTSDYGISRGAGQESPYFPLCESSEAFRSGISKSVLQTLRTARNKFSALGLLTFREFSEVGTADELLSVVLTVDRQSWKHAAGTAITAQPRQERFYKALFVRAMASHMLQAEVIYLRDQPIAYNFGLRRANVYSCLKHSNVQEYDKLSPNTLLNESMFARLRGQGVVTYDFMGAMEPHKLRWSSLNGSYQRSTWTISNRTLRARVAKFAQRQFDKAAQILK